MPATLEPVAAHQEEATLHEVDCTAPDSTPFTHGFYMDYGRVVKWGRIPRDGAADDFARISAAERRALQARAIPLRLYPEPSAPAEVTAESVNAIRHGYGFHRKGMSPAKREAAAKAENARNAKEHARKLARRAAVLEKAAQIGFAF